MYGSTDISVLQGRIALYEDMKATVAGGFSQITYPWPNLPTDEGAYYNSMFLFNDTTLIALTTRNFSDGHSEVWWKRGTLKR